MTRDRITGIIALVLGIIVAVATYNLPASNMAGDIGPQAFPAISAGLLILCGGALAITGGQKPRFTFTKEQALRLASIAAVMILYVVCIEQFGFVVPSALVCFVLVQMFKKDKKVPLWQQVVFSIALPVLLYFIFTKGFSMRLPHGKLFHIL